MQAGTPFRPTTHGRRPWVSLTRRKTRTASGANYGPQASDRRNLFNIAYSIDEGTLFHKNGLVDGVGNGWQLSGIIQAESGTNLTYGGNVSNQTPNLNYNMSLTCVATAAEKAAGISCPQSSAIIPGSISTANPTGIAINNQSILGTSDQVLTPLYTCRGQAGQPKAQEYVNSNCFAAPTVPGQGGPNMLPVAYGPAFFNADLSIFKNFAIKESMKLQIRAQAYNFLNHPLWSFPSGNNLTLQFQQDPVSQVITQTNTNFGVANTQAGTAGYRVWSEVLLLIPQEHKQQRNKTRGLLTYRYTCSGNREQLPVCRSPHFFLL